MRHDGSERPPDDPAQAAAVLAKRFRCTWADLAENRVGRLTRRQRRRLIGWIVLDALLGTLGFLAGTGLFVLPAIFALRDLVTGKATSDTGYTLTLCAPFIFILLMVAVGVPNSRMADLLDVLRAAAPVQCRTGEVVVQETGDGWTEMTGPLAHWLMTKIADPASVVPGRYAVYYVDLPTRPPVLLAAELLPQDAAV